MSGKSLKSSLWALVFVLFIAGICSAQSVLYFPQFVDGPKAGSIMWRTAIAVTNSAAIGTPAVTGTIALMQDDGTPMNVALIDENGAPAGNTFQLAGGQTKFFISSAQAGSTDSPQLNTGYATVTSDLPVSGDLVFLSGDANGMTGMAGVSAATPLTSQATVVVKDQNTNTGVAVANPGTEMATITIQLLDKAGTPIVEPVTQTLAANNHTSFLVTDVFPNVPDTVYGTMRITSDKPIVSTALLFNGSTFASLPVISHQSQ